MVANANTPLFKKGHCGNPNGRPKGAKNKVNRFDFAQTCLDHNFNPCVELIKIAQYGKSEHARVTACAEISSYLLPKLRAVEISATDAKERFSMVMNFGAIKEGETEEDVVDNVHGEQDGEQIPQ